jgi:hypothetical protein
MKKVLFILMAVLVTAQVSATVLLVKEYGVNGTYSTIQSAIDATAEGDTVLVFPKPSGISWNEGTLNLIHQIILLDSDGSCFSQNGNSSLSIEIADGRQYNFMGWCWSGRDLNFTGSASQTNKCIINIIDCHFNNVNLGIPGIDARVMNNQINHLYINYGVIIANNVNYIHVGYEFSNNSTDSILIIANDHCDIEIHTHYYVWLYNNWVREQDNNYALQIHDMNDGGDNYNIIANNTFYYDYTEGVAIEYHSNTKITNNFFYVSNSSSNTWALVATGGYNGTPFVSYNYANNNTNNANHNRTNVPYGLEYNCFGNCNEGNYSVGGRGKVNTPNTGNYLGQYNDIDLTRNDVGTYGGPHSIDNFWDQPNPNNSKARINFLNLPHFFTTPGTIDLKGGAHIRD